MRKFRIAMVFEGGKMIGVLTRIDLIDHVARFSGKNA
jgi:predicted transcriptional regulator